MVIETTCDSDFSTIANEVLAGKMIVFPTDTVYGLGSNPRSRDGVLRCLSIKNRDSSKQMPVLVSSLAAAREIVLFNDLADSLATRFWPGKLTIILPAKDPGLPRVLTGEKGTIAVRVPKHECCQHLISACGGSLIGTSANLSGNPPFIDPSDPVLREFSKQSDYFVKGACGSDRRPSTIVDLSQKTGPPSLVREGAVPKEEILGYLEKMSSNDLSFRATTI